CQPADAAAAVERALVGGAARPQEAGPEQAADRPTPSGQRTGSVAAVQRGFTARPGSGPPLALVSSSQLVDSLLVPKTATRIYPSPSAFLNKKCLLPAGFAWHHRVQNPTTEPVTQR